MRIKKILAQLGFDDISRSSALAMRTKLMRDRPGKPSSKSGPLEAFYSKLNRSLAAPAFSKIANFFYDKASVDPNALPKDEFVGVIVETRSHPNLETVVLNFIKHTKLAVQIYHGVCNERFIRESRINEFVERGRVVLYRLPADELDAPMVNAMFLSKKFWDTMISRNKVFFFQTDSWICEQSEYALDDFIDFDYIGSRWPRRRPNGMVADGGSGGLSIRSWSKSVECLENFPPELWAGGEDGYFAFHIELLGGKIGRKKDCARFSTQQFFTHKSYGAHRITLLPATQQKKFIEYCPQAKILLRSIS